MIHGGLDAATVNLPANPLASRTSFLVGRWVAQGWSAKLSPPSSTWRPRAPRGLCSPNASRSRAKVPSAWSSSSLPSTYYCTLVLSPCPFLCCCSLSFVYICPIACCCHRSLLLLLLSLSLSLSLLLRALHKQPSIYAEICISTSTPSFAIEVSLQVIELETTYSTPGYRHRESILLYHTYTSINILSTTDQASHRPQPNTYNRNQVDPATHTSLHRPTNT